MYYVLGAEVANWRPLPPTLLIASAIPSIALHCRGHNTRIRYVRIRTNCFLYRSCQRKMGKVICMAR